MKQKLLALITLCCVLAIALSTICAAKGKKDDSAARAQAVLAHVSQANTLCDTYVCRYDQEANVYTFVPRPEALARLSGKAATMIPSVAYAGNDGATLFRMLFSYGGLEYIDLADITLDANGKEMSFTVPEGAATKEQQKGFVTEDYAAGFDGAILDEFYDVATAGADADRKDVLRFTGQNGTAERTLTAYDKSVLREAIDIYRALASEPEE